MHIVIDWSAFDTWPESTVTCAQDHTYRSHAKMIQAPKGFELIARKPCPTCGTIELRSSRSDPESFSF